MYVGSEGGVGLMVMHPVLGWICEVGGFAADGRGSGLWERSLESWGVEIWVRGK